MDWVWIVVGGYLLIGVFKAGDHIVNLHKVGTSGPWVTFVAVTLFWPFV